MATPTNALLHLSTAHSRASSIRPLSWAIVPASSDSEYNAVKSCLDKEVVPRKARTMERCDCVGHFAVRGRRSRAVCSHSLSASSEGHSSGSKGARCSGPFRTEYRVLSGSHNKSFQRTPNTPRPAANAFGIISQQPTARLAPLN